MTNLEQELVNEYQKQRKDLTRIALNPGSSNRYRSVAFCYKKVEHQIIYDRQLGRFVKIIYLTKADRLARANELIL